MKRTDSEKNKRAGILHAKLISMASYEETMSTLPLPHPHSSTACTHLAAPVLGTCWPARHTPQRTPAAAAGAAQQLQDGPGWLLQDQPVSAPPAGQWQGGSSSNRWATMNGKNSQPVNKQEGVLQACWHCRCKATLPMYCRRQDPTPVMLCPEPCLGAVATATVWYTKTLVECTNCS